MPPPFDPVPHFYPITDRTRSWRAAIGIPSGKTPPVAPPPNAMLDAAVTLSEPYVAGDNFGLLIAGRWYGHNYQPGPPAGSGSFDPPPIAYNQLFSYTRPGIAAVTNDDRVFMLRFRGQQLMATVEFGQFSQPDGTQTLTGTETQVATASQSITATADVAGAISRVMALTPGGTTNTSWAINAVGESPYNFPQGIQLTAGGFDPALGSINAQFGNPFPGRKPMLLWLLAGVRNEVDPEGPTWPHFRVLHTFDRDPVSGKRYVADQGLPNGVSLNGVLLANDRQALAIPQNQTVELVFTADRMDGEYRHIDCYRYDLNPQRHTIVLSTRVIGDRVRIPATALPRGARYMCRAHLFKGVPMAGDGDDTVRDPALRFGFYDSASFIVQ